MNKSILDHTIVPVYIKGIAAGHWKKNMGGEKIPDGNGPNRRGGMFFYILYNLRFWRGNERSSSERLLGLMWSTERRRWPPGVDDGRSVVVSARCPAALVRRPS